MKFFQFVLLLSGIVILSTLSADDPQFTLRAIGGVNCIAVSVYMQGKKI